MFVTELKGRSRDVEADMITKAILHRLERQHPDGQLPKRLRDATPTILGYAMRVPGFSNTDAKEATDGLDQFELNEVAQTIRNVVVEREDAGISQYITRDDIEEFLAYCRQARGVDV